MFDLSKAFDTVSRVIIIINKLKCYAVTGIELNILASSWAATESTSE